MSGITEGPWENNGNAVHKRISPHYAECIAICEGPNRRENAAAIAALPDLLAAVRGAMKIVSLWNGREVPEDHEHYEENKALYLMQEQFIAALAKAEGKTP